MIHFKFDASWEMDEAVELIREMEPQASALDMHVGMTGSVLFKGKSEKDLDIVVYGHDNSDIEVEDLYVLAQAVGLTPLRVIPSTENLAVACQTEDGRRVDLLGFNRGTKEDS